MRFSGCLLGAIAVAIAWAAIASTSPKSDGALTKRKGKFLLTGVNQAGGEFGKNNLPGQLNKDYTWPAHSSIDILMSKGFNIFRVPFLMERIIPDKLTGSINETYFQGLNDIVAYITSKGASAAIVSQNFGRYYGSIITDTTGFQTYWNTIAKRFARNSKVIFDTNNEFHDMPNSLVTNLNQAAINGIRAAGATSQQIFVEGNSYTAASTWVSSGTGNSLLSLTDPYNKIVYEMHQYLDSDGSGAHPECVSTTIGVERIKEATQWLKDNNKIGILGETAAGPNIQCIEALKLMLQYMEDNPNWIGFALWAAGPWWGQTYFSMEPPSGTAFTSVLPSIMDFI